MNGDKQVTAMNPESGSFMLVSLRRRNKDRRS